MRHWLEFSFRYFFYFVTLMEASCYWGFILYFVLLFKLTHPNHYGFWYIIRTIISPCPRILYFKNLSCTTLYVVSYRVLCLCPYFKFISKAWEHVYGLLQHLVAFQQSALDTHITKSKKLSQKLGESSRRSRFVN